MIKSAINRLKDTSKPFWFDWAFLGVLFVSAFLLFSQAGDITITLRHSNDLIDFTLNGKFFNFYGEVLHKALTGGYGFPAYTQAAFYNILIYITFALWLLPLKVFCHIFNLVASDFVLSMYGKLFVLILVLLSAYIIYKLGKKIGLNENKSKWLGFIYLSSPMLIFGSILFGQYDIFSSILTLLALLFFFDKKFYKFCLIMSLAICFKIFAILIFIPLILLVEKRIIHIIKYGLLGMAFYILTRFIYLWDKGYAITQKEMDKIYGFSGWISSVQIKGGITDIGIFVFLLIMICAFAYFIKPKIENINKMAILISLTGYSIFFIFVPWHPQWIVILCPFIAIAIFMTTNFKMAVLVDSVIAASYLVETVIIYTKNVDNYMVNHGILPYIFGYDYHRLTLRGIFDMSKISFIFPLTVFAACLVILICIIIYEFKKNKESHNLIESINEVKLERGVIWIRASVLLAYMFPTLVLYFFHH
jgi:hypothetical protein